MAAERKMHFLDLPGINLGDPDFHSSGPAPVPDESNNGNIGFDDQYGGKPGKSLTGPGPWKNLRTGRK